MRIHHRYFDLEGTGDMGSYCLNGTLLGFVDAHCDLGRMVDSWNEISGSSGIFLRRFLVCLVLFCAVQ